MVYGLILLLLIPIEALILSRIFKKTLIGPTDLEDLWGNCYLAKKLPFAFFRYNKVNRFFSLSRTPSFRSLPISAERPLRSTSK